MAEQLRSSLDYEPTPSPETRVDLHVASGHVDSVEAGRARVAADTLFTAVPPEKPPTHVQEARRVSNNLVLLRSSLLDEHEQPLRPAA